MLATYIIENVKLPAGGLMLYYLCSHKSQTPHDILNTLLSVLTAQILRNKRHLVPYVFETYVQNAEQPALKLPALLRQLLTCLPTTYVVIDGLNECDSGTQSRIINKLDSIVASRRNETTAGPDVRILVSSHEAKGVPHKLLKQPSISLTEEDAYVSHDIKVYTMNTINSLEDRFDQKVVEEIASLIMAKANGMFLWVKLVLLTLLEQESLFEIRTTLDRLPTGLAGIYKILLQRLEELADSRQRPRIRMIFYWMVFALRPMKVWEICDALVIGGSNMVLVKDHTMLHPRILDICKPLIEVHKDQTVSFVHFSVKAYLLDIDSGPFVVQKDGLTHVTSTCLKYLFTCEDFFSAQKSIDTYRQIVFQLHSLFLYVAESWKNHFIALAAYLSIPLDESEVLLSSLLADGTDLKDHRKILSSCQQDQQATTPQDPIQIRTDREVVMRGILQSLRNVFVGSKEDEHFTLSNENRRDLVKQAFMCFQLQFEALLSGECPYSLSELGASQADLDFFRNRYATAAFLCRWIKCPYSILGFSNIEERARHERNHATQFCCTELGCDFQNSGFASRTALRNHVQKYHKKQEDSAVPKLSLGRSEATKVGSPTLNKTKDVLYVDQNRMREAEKLSAQDNIRIQQQQQQQSINHNQNQNHPFRPTTEGFDKMTPAEQEKFKHEQKKYESIRKVAQLSQEVNAMKKPPPITNMDPQNRQRITAMLSSATLKKILILFDVYLLAFAQNNSDLQMLQTLIQHRWRLLQQYQPASVANKTFVPADLFTLHAENLEAVINQVTNKFRKTIEESQRSKNVQ